MTLRYRLIIIALLIAASVWALVPRTVVQRVDSGTGPVKYDTVRRVPIRRGLDLEGGMHLALEVDQSKGAVPNMSDAIDRALKVVRTRIDQFGVSEPVVQKAGSDRIIVDLPGVQDQQRAYDIVKEAAFLQMQIVDKTDGLDKAVPHIDAILKAKGLGAPAEVPGVTPAGDAGVQSLFANADSGKPRADSGKTTRLAAGRPGAKGAGAHADSAKTKGDSARRDTGSLAALTNGGAFSQLIQAGNMPGEYYVAESAVPTVTRYLSLPEVQALIPPGKVYPVVQ